jgi:hypothetical protein
VFALALSQTSVAALIGPGYPLPGGTLCCSAGGTLAKDLGGTTWTYTGFDLAGAGIASAFFGNKYLDFAGDGSADGSHGLDREHLSPDSPGFFIGGGSVTFFGGETAITGVTSSIATMFKFTATDMTLVPLLTFSPHTGDGANGFLLDVTDAINITGGFKVTMEAFFVPTGLGSETAAGPYFDGLPTPPGAGGDLIIDFENGLWYEPIESGVSEPMTIVILGLGLMGLGARRRALTAG